MQEPRHACAGPASARPEVTGPQAFVTFGVGEDWFCLPVGAVEDVLVLERITPIPLAPPAVRGAVNLRGRIATVIDLRRRMGLSARDDGTRGLCVTVSHRGDAYALAVDRVGDIANFGADAREPVPAALDPVWRACVLGIHRQPTGLVLELDVDRLLDFGLSLA